MIADDISTLAKWLNEEQTGPMNRSALARVLAHIQQTAQEQEPVACVIDGDLYFHHEIDWEDLAYQGHGVELLYTHPAPAAQPAPQRSEDKEWKGLTPADRKEIERKSVYVEGAIRMTEAKLREKNTGETK